MNTKILRLQKFNSKVVAPFFFSFTFGYIPHTFNYIRCCRYQPLATLHLFIVILNERTNVACTWFCCFYTIFFWHCSIYCLWRLSYLHFFFLFFFLLIKENFAISEGMYICIGILMSLAANESQKTIISTGNNLIFFLSFYYRNCNYVSNSREILF